MKRIIYCKLINVIIALTAVTLSQAQTIIAPTSSREVQVSPLSQIKRLGKSANLKFYTTEMYWNKNN